MLLVIVKGPRSRRGWHVATTAGTGWCARPSSCSASAATRPPRSATCSPAAARPRGSIYHHFPGGKEELAAEALRRYTAASVRALRRGREHGSAVDAVRAFVTASRDALVASDYRQSCPIAGRGAGPDAGRQRAGRPRRRRRSTAGARCSRDALERDGVPAARAALAWRRSWWPAAEGALLLGRADRSPAPVDAVVAELVAHVTAVVAGTRAGADNTGSGAADKTDTAPAEYHGGDHA